MSNIHKWTIKLAVCAFSILITSPLPAFASTDWFTGGSYSRTPSGSTPAMPVTLEEDFDTASTDFIPGLCSGNYFLFGYYTTQNAYVFPDSGGCYWDGSKCIASPKYTIGQSILGYTDNDNSPIFCCTNNSHTASVCINITDEAGFTVQQATSASTSTAQSLEDQALTIDFGVSLIVFLLSFICCVLVWK